MVRHHRGRQDPRAKGHQARQIHEPKRQRALGRDFGEGFRQVVRRIPSTGRRSLPLGVARDDRRLRIHVSLARDQVGAAGHVFCRRRRRAQGPAPNRICKRGRRGRAGRGQVLPRPA